jgi:hypothetical protein
MDIKQEIRVLNSSAELIKHYVNNAVCCFPEDPTEIVRTVLPQTHLSKRYFYILLLDVIAGVNIELVPDKENGDNLLTLLNKISCNPLLNKNHENTKALQRSTEDFITWLEKEFEYDIWSANISTQVKIKLSRKEALYLIGNRCKHSLLRSNSILEKLVKLYKAGGVDLDPGSELLLLEDIDVWLLDDFGSYHFTKLCELSVKVYYGILQYIRPVYNQNIYKIDAARYAYKIPLIITDNVSKFEYYELLNRARKSYLPAIETSESLQQQY